VNSQLTAPTALLPWNDVVTHWIKSWVGPTDNLDVLEKIIRFEHSPWLCFNNVHLKTPFRKSSLYIFFRQNTNKGIFVWELFQQYTLDNDFKQGVIKSNHIPPFFGGSHHRHQGNSLHKVKRCIKRNCVIVHTQLGPFHIIYQNRTWWAQNNNSCVRWEAVRYSYSIHRHYCSALQKQSSAAHDNRPYCPATPHPKLIATELAYNYRINSRG